MTTTMTMNMQGLTQFRKTPFGYAVVGAAELAAAYGFANLAIDQGSWWWYVLALISLVGALQNLAKLVGKIIYDKTRRTR